MSWERCQRCGIGFQPVVPTTIRLHSAKYGSFSLCRACSNSFDAWLHFENISSCRMKEEPGYGDVIQEIMQSDMMTVHKQRSIKYVKRNETPDYYQAIMTIVNSDMMSSDRMNLIFDLSKE